MNTRRMRIAFEYLTGTSVEKIAHDEGVSTQRIYQELQRVARSLNLPYITLVKHDPERYMRNLRAMNSAGRYTVDQAQTPEEFFHELLREPRRMNL